MYVLQYMFFYQLLLVFSFNAANLPTTHASLNLIKLVFTKYLLRHRQHKSHIEGSVKEEILNLYVIIYS